MPMEKPSAEDAAKVMTLHQEKLEKKFHKDWAARNIKNEFKEALLSRLVDLVKTDGDDEEEKRARNKIVEELKRRALDFEAPKVRIIEPSTIHADGWYLYRYGPPYDYTWSTPNSSADKNGTISIGNYAFGDDNSSTYWAAGVGKWFSPPIEGVWTIHATTEYQFGWYIGNGLFAGASTSAFCAVTVYAYLNGVYQPQDTFELRFPLWDAGVGPGLVDANLQNNGDNVTINPTVILGLQPGYGYVVWTWFGLNTGAGLGGFATGEIQAAASSTTFSCVF